jgi:hypothetical protein
MLALVVALTAVVTAAPNAGAEETTCRRSYGSVTFDNVRVPRGATCTLNGTTIKGTLKIEGGGTLKASSIRVVGNIQGEGHRSVTINGTTRVGGSIQLDQGGWFKIDSARVTGSIQVKSNSGSSRLNRNVVNGDIQVFSHRNGISITSNRIDGNLQCKGNRPAPTGGGNVVQGNKEDQCRRL